jgi:Hen1-like subunit of RNA repair complex
MRIATASSSAPVDGSSATCDSYNPTMLLTLTTTHNPATDLGYLLHKNPAKLHSFELSFGSTGEIRTQGTLRRVHECVFGVLALESEPVDPRLWIAPGMDKSSSIFLKSGCVSHAVTPTPFVTLTYETSMPQESPASAITSGCCLFT